MIRQRHISWCFRLMWLYAKIEIGSQKRYKFSDKKCNKTDNGNNFTTIYRISPQKYVNARSVPRQQTTCLQLVPVQSQTPRRSQEGTIAFILLPILASIGKHIVQYGHKQPPQFLAGDRITDKHRTHILVKQKTMKPLI